MDNLGAMGGPLLALALVALLGIRTAILLSFIPGVLAALAIIAAVRAAPRLSQRERKPLQIQVRPVLRGQLGRLLSAITAFELGNAAATLLILRATELLEPHQGHAVAVKIALGLYAGYNLAATVVAIPGGQMTDRRGSVLVLSLAAAAFTGSFIGLAVVGASIPLIAVLFVLGGVGIGLGETAQSAAIATHSLPELRGSAFGLVSAVQAFANLAASAIAGVLWTTVSPEAGFLYLAGWSAIAMLLFLQSFPGEQRARTGA